jgi:transcriptional regulator with XRE-family HTH domain
MPRFGGAPFFQKKFGQLFIGGAGSAGAAASTRGSAMNTEPSTKPVSIRRRAQDIDRHIGARVRERRIMLGLTQQQLAELIGTTVQQAHKYETGINRVSSGRLYEIAQALDTDVGYFFEGMGRDDMFMPTRQQRRLLLELARDFMAIPSRRHQEELVSLARALAEPGP